ncbi:MAG: hypothetical protein ACKO3R_10085 [bacterium]
MVSINPAPPAAVTVKQTPATAISKEPSPQPSTPAPTGGRGLDIH